MKKTFCLFAAAVLAFTAAFSFLPDTAQAAERPARVSGVKAVSTDSLGIKVSWKKAARAGGYKIYIASSKNGKYKAAATAKGSGRKSAVVSGLSAGKTYWVKLRAYRKSGGKTIYGKYSAARSVRIKPKRTAVSSYSAAKSTTTGAALRLSLKKASGASGYQIYAATSKKGRYTAKYRGTSRTAIISGLTPGRTYWIKTRAYTSYGGKRIYGSWSAPVSITVSPYTPSPTRAVALSDSTAKVYWPQEQSAHRMELFHYTSPGEQALSTAVKHGTTAKTQYTATGLKKGATYWFTLRASCTYAGARKYGSQSEHMLKYTAWFVRPPQVQLVDKSSDGTVLRWTMTAAGGYEVYRAEEKDGNYALVGTTPGGVTAFRDSEAPAGATAFYKVRGFDSVNGEACYSELSAAIEA